MKAKNIPGIYNYCDSWCERCKFTSRCLNFEMGNEFVSKKKKIGEDSYLEEVSKNLDQALNLLHQVANEEGIDLDAWTPEQEKAWEQKRKKSDQILKEHELSRVTREYSNRALDLLEKKPVFRKKLLNLLNEVKMGVRTASETLDEAGLISDCLEVVQWYVHFIHVKFQRALRGLIDDDGWEVKNGFPRDCDGSAKIALIATDRSIEAWLRINDLMPGNEDDILQLLALLQKIKRLGEREFPKARAFIRPGFD